MAADVPLLTQDDFLSHLKLQPVTSKAAFAYRHALKERLRATTRVQEGGTGSCSLSPRAKAKRMKMANKMYNSNSSSSSPTRSTASKRLFSGLPKTESTDRSAEEGVNVKSTRAILETLVNNCNMYLHPKVKEEIGSYGLSKMDKRQFVEKETILERNTYLPGSRKTTVVSFHQHPLPPPNTPAKEQGEKQYSCKVLLQSPVSSAKRLDKDKLLMTARVKVTRLRRSQLQHKTRILIQPKVDPEDVRSRMLPSSVSYPSILPLVAHIERTKEELLDRNCDSPLPVYNDPPTRVKKAKKTSSTASSNNSKPSSDKSSASKDSGVVLEDVDDLDLECRICHKKFYSYSGLNKHLLRGHCPVCKAPVNSKVALATAGDGNCKTTEKAAAVSKAKLGGGGAWSICQKCVQSLPLVSSKLLNGNSAIKDNEHEVACDICTSRFRRRIHMIKHVMTQHASQMHRVDLAKFVATGTAPSVSVQSVTTSGAAAHSPWMDNEC